MTEQDLLDLRTGDQEAWKRMVALHTPALSRWCGSLAWGLKDRAVEADDLVNTTWCKAHRSLASFGGPASGFQSWLFTIAKHASTDLWRRQRGTEVSIDSDLLTIHPAHTTAPDQQVLDSDLARFLTAAISALPERIRHIVVLRDVEEMEPTDVAVALGMTVGAVNASLARGHRLIRAFYGLAFEAATCHDIVNMYARQDLPQSTLTSLIGVFLGIWREGHEKEQEAARA